MARKANERVCVEERIKRVTDMHPNFKYKISDIMYATGWSAASIYNMMASCPPLLPFSVQGSHRRVLGKIVKSVFFTKL